MPAEAEAAASAAGEFAEALRDASRALVTYLVRQAHASDLGLVEYLILARASDRGGVTARDAARAFDLSTSTMTGISDRLEKDELVRRAAHPTDRRVLVLKATRRGREIIERTTVPLLADLGLLAAVLAPEQRASLTRSMQQISARMLQKS